VEGEPGDLSHLTPAARAAAFLPKDERICRIRADRWIGYPRALEALGRLDTLLQGPPKQRMPNLLIVGSTNNGKSMIVEKFRRSHPHEPGPSSERETLPVLVVQMPSESSIVRFYALLLARMGAPLRPRARVAELEQLALRLMRAVGARMLIIDELHNILAGKADVRREFLNLIRFLGNELRIPIVGVGTHEAYLAVRADEQLENRFEPIVLPVWDEGETTCSLLASFAAALPLRRRSELATPDLARYVLARSEGTIGEISRLVTAAAVAAVETGEEAIDRKTLTLANYESPTERRRSFSLVSWVPLLLDGRDPVPGSFQSYVGEWSVLLPPTAHAPCDPRGLAAVAPPGATPARPGVPGLSRGGCGTVRAVPLAAPPDGVVPDPRPDAGARRHRPRGRRGVGAGRGRGGAGGDPPDGRADLGRADLRRGGPPAASGPCRRLVPVVAGAAGRAESAAEVRAAAPGLTGGGLGPGRWGAARRPGPVEAVRGVGGAGATHVPPGGRDRAGDDRGARGPAPGGSGGSVPPGAGHRARPPAPGIVFQRVYKNG
jgi:type II secretory pathway predicted ATPase ExeA